MKPGHRLIKENNLSDLKHIVWKNLPYGVSTFSQCSCGRNSRRGGYPCLECVMEALGWFVGENIARLYIEQIKALRLLEAEMEERDNG